MSTENVDAADIAPAAPGGPETPPSGLGEAGASDPAASAQPVLVEATATERLAQLHAAYPAAKAAADEAAARLKAVTDGIKLELTTAAGPDARKVDLPATADGPALRLAYVERAIFDSTRLKRDNPLLYVQYAKFGGSWVLKAVKAGEQE